MPVVTNKELIEGYGISGEEIAELEAQADAFDAGEWPAGKTKRVGRPRTLEEETRPITFRLAVGKIDAVDRLADERGVSRGAVFREAVDLLLEQA